MLLKSNPLLADNEMEFNILIFPCFYFFCGLLFYVCHFVLFSLNFAMLIDAKFCSVLSSNFLLTPI